MDTVDQLRSSGSLRCAELLGCKAGSQLGSRVFFCVAQRCSYSAPQNTPLLLDTWEFPKIRGPNRNAKSRARIVRTLTKKNPQFTETALCFSLSPENQSGALPGAGSGRESAAPRGLRGSANSCADSIGGPLCGCPHNMIPTVWDLNSGPWFIGKLPFASSRGFRDLKWQELHTSSSETSVLYLNKVTPRETTRAIAGVRFRAKSYSTEVKR